MITSGGTAPYAPKDSVLEVIHAWRDRPVPTPLTADVVEKIGVRASLVPRTIQAFRLLDLIDKSGNPTPAMQDLRKAGSDEYRTRLAEIIRAAYAEVFTYRDPTTDSPDKIEDAFRSFEPVGMRPRMVRLFLGLCEEAGIIEAAPSSRGGAPRTAAIDAASPKPNHSERPATVRATSQVGDVQARPARLDRQGHKREPTTWRFEACSKRSRRLVRSSRTRSGVSGPPRSSRSST